jgi:hypothetical protein
VAVSGRVAGDEGRVALVVERYAGRRWMRVARATARLAAGRFARVFRGLRSGRYRVHVRTSDAAAPPSYEAFRV